MRERWARGLAVITGLLVLLLSGAFAAVQNPAAPGTAATGPAATKDAASDPQQLARGEAALETHGCLRCHSVAGRGSPRSPLDGVGARRTPDAIRHWIVADAAVQEELAPRVIAAKQGYAELPPDELDALVAYLASLAGDG